MLKNTEDIIFLKISFPIIPMGAIRYSCTIRLVPTYVYTTCKRHKTFGKSFSPIALKLT